MEERRPVTGQQQRGIGGNNTSIYRYNHLSEKLEEADVSTDRLVPLIPGEKRTYLKEWATKELDKLSSNNLDSYGIRTGNGLIVLDVDQWRKLPNQIKQYIEENPTLKIQTPHSTGKEGHYYYLVPEAVKSTSGDGYDLKAIGGYTVGPQSEITRCKYDCCTNQSPGRYSVEEDRPIAQISRDELEAITDKTLAPEHRSTSDYSKREIKRTPNQDKVAIVEALIGNFLNDSQTSRRAKKKLRDLSRGKYRQWDYSDRSEPEIALCSMLWGIVHHYGDEEDNPEELIEEYLIHVANKHRMDRKYMRDLRTLTEYFIGRVKEDFRPEIWRKWQRKTSEPTSQSNPSWELTITVVWELFQSESLTLSELAERADYSKKQLRKALNWLRDRDYVIQTVDPDDNRRKPWQIAFEDSELHQVTDNIEAGLNSITEREDYLARMNVKRFGSDSRLD